MKHPRLEKAAAVCVFVLVTVFAAGYMVTHAADYWKMKRERFSATAGATLTSGNLVCLDSTGNARLADADDAARRPALGVIAIGGDTGSTVEIVTNGIWMSDSTTVGAGDRLFLSETPGEFTGTAPANGQVVGFVGPNGTDYHIRLMLCPSGGAGY